MLTYVLPGSRPATFRDDSDGKTNNRIDIDIDPDSNYVEPGTRTSDVYGERVPFQRPYTLNFYLR